MLDGQIYIAGERGRLVHALQEPLKEVLEWLWKQQIIVPLGVNEMLEWCNSFVLVPKANCKVPLCLDPDRLNEVLIKPVQRSNSEWGVKYLTIIHASSGYHNLKLDKQFIILNHILCPFGRYRYTWLPFGVGPPGDMFHKKIDDLFYGMFNIFGIANNILIAGCDELGRDHNATIDTVLRICRKANLKRNRDKCLFRSTRIPFSVK